MTGIDSETSQDIAEAISLKGGRYLEAQIQGSKTQAQDGTEINYCFSQLMERHGFPPNERSHRGVCLLPRSSRVNMHDFEHFRPGDIFKHSHGKYSPAVGSC